MCRRKHYFYKIIVEPLSWPVICVFLDGQLRQQRTESFGNVQGVPHEPIYGLLHPNKGCNCKPAFKESSLTCSLHIPASHNHVSSFQNKAEMEHELSVPTSDGGQKTEAQVVHDVLSKKSSQPTFLQNAGVVYQPSQLSRPSRVTKRKLAAELEREKSASAELRNLVNVQIYQMDKMAAEADRKSTRLNSSHAQ